MVSLCVSGGGQWLYRVADVDSDNVLLPYRAESNQMLEKLMCTPDMAMPKNTLEFWEWEPEGNRRYAMPSQIRLRWIEFVRLESCGSLEKLRNALINGIEGDFPNDHDYLIGIAESRNGKSSCVFARAESLKKKNNLTVFGDAASSFDVYEVQDSEIAEVKKSYLPGFCKLCYLRLDLPEKSKTVFARDPSETARLAILKRLGASAKEVLPDRQSGTVIDAISQECGCSRQDAELLFGEMVQNAGKRFSDDLMLHVIGCDSEAAEKWESENLAKIREKARLESELSFLSELKNSGLKEQERLSAQLEDMKMQLSGLRGQPMPHMQENQASILEGMGEIFKRSSGFEEGHPVSGNDFFLESAALVATLSENLDAASVDRSRSCGLAACLISANFQNMPLIIAGYNAAAIVDALSATLFNRTADRYYCCNSCIDIPKGETPIAVFDGFGCMNRIIEKAKGRHVCFIAQTSEELGIEPRGLYNYALPLFTEHFIVEEFEPKEMEGYLYQGSKQLKLKARETFSLPIGTLLPLAKTRLDNMLGGMHFLKNDLTAMQLLLVSCVPILVSLSRKQELIDIIAPLNLSSAERTELTLIIGAAS